MEKAREAADTVEGFFSGVKTRLRVDDFVEKVRDSKDYIIDIVLYTGIGFVAGYLIKRYSAYVVMMILTGVFLALLQHFDLIKVVVNFEKIQAALDVDASLLADDNLIGLICLWLKMHVALAISFVIGFLIGLRCA